MGVTLEREVTTEKVETRPKGTIRESAQVLADGALAIIPEIVAIYLFPDDEEVRLIRVEHDSLPDEGDGVVAFSFRAHPKHGVHFPHAMAVVRPEEVGVLELPEGWGTWQDAIQLWPRK